MNSIWQMLCKLWRIIMFIAPLFLYFRTATYNTVAICQAQSGAYMRIQYPDVHLLLLHRVLGRRSIQSLERCSLGRFKFASTHRYIAFRFTWRVCAAASYCEPTPGSSSSSGAFLDWGAASAAAA
jgi:hypothetical protein